MKKFILLLISTLLLVNISFAATNPVDPSSESIYINKDTKIVPITQHTEDKNLHYVINVTYPSVAGKNLTSNAKKFNQLMTSIITEEMQKFKKNVQQDMPHMQTLPEAVKHNTLTIDYDIDIITPPKQSYVSVRLNIESMQAGRTHPFHTHRVLNFDLTHGKVLALSNLFNPHSNFLKLMANYSNKKLNDTLQDKWMIATGTKANIVNFKNWNLEADGILVTFDEYQVAPYSYGAQEVEIPYTALKVILSASAPIGPADPVNQTQIG